MCVVVVLERKSGVGGRGGGVGVGWSSRPCVQAGLGDVTVEARGDSHGSLIFNQAHGADG